jgi:hypothetical protein
MARDIFEKIQILRHNYMYTNYKVRQLTLFVGQEQWYELLSSTVYYGLVNIGESVSTCMGMIVQRVIEDSYLAVAEVLEYKESEGEVDG